MSEMQLNEKQFNQQQKNENNRIQKIQEFIALKEIRHNFSLLKLIDWPLIMMTVVLIAIGLLFIFSSSYFNEGVFIGLQATTSLVKRQFIMGCLGYVLIMFLIIFPEKWYSNLILMTLLYIGMIALLLYTVLSGNVVYGSSNWVRIGGIVFQPGELLKVLTVLYSAIWIESRITLKSVSPKFKLTKKEWGMIGCVIVSLLFLMAMPDFGMVAIILLGLFALYSINFLSVKTNIICMLCIGVLYAVARVAISSFAESLIDTAHYAVQRMLIFVNPFIDASGTGYQIIGGFKAFQRGHWTGLGIGESQAIQEGLFATNTDFISAIIAEETGFLGYTGVMVLMMTLYIYIFYRGLQCKNRWRRNVIFGLVMMLVIQVFVNLGGVLSLIPLTGVTLPFISYGGSSLLTSLIMIGIIQKMLVEEKNEVQTNSDLNLVGGVNDGI